MNKKDILSNTGGSLYLITMSLIISIAVALSGCTKEKMMEEIRPLKSTTTCQIHEKLPPDIMKNSSVNYAGKAKFLGIVTKKVSQNHLKVSYYWQLLDELGPFNRVFVHFTDQENKALFQNDHDFCQSHSFEEVKGKIIEESDTLVVPPFAIDKELSIKIGFYSLDPKAGGRLKIVETGGMLTDEDKTRAIVAKVKG